MSAAARRLAVPGPVWGWRPQRPEARVPADELPRASPRGPRADPLARVAARWRGTDVATLADRASYRAAALASAPPRRLDAALEHALARIARDGLAPRPVAAALGAAGAAMALATGLRPRDNQYRCALHLLDERLVELDTGEGKSVAIALAAGVAALAGSPVHVLTANDYLADRDARGFGEYYRRLGLAAGAATESAGESARREAWRADVAYTTARTVGFDLLRDGLAQSPALLSRGLCVAIVDEADAVLVDEARTPLVLGRTRDDPALRARAWRALDVARRLDAGRHARIDAGHGSASLTDEGRARTAALVAEDCGGDLLEARLVGELVEQALVALHALHRDVHYVVEGREAVLVDATTGRRSPGRTLSRSLQALVAIKERLPVPPATDTSARLTCPRLMARYHHLCGTSGTLGEAAGELREVYGLRVARVAPSHPSAMRRAPTRAFADRDAQFTAAIGRARGIAASGRCVLVATDSVADSIALADRFAASGVAVEVLDARHDRDEHDRIGRAGDAGRITVVTQVAGRGTDPRPAAAALAAGGLHVLSLQHNRSARTDRQVLGRAARRGEPGSAERYLRLGDSPLDPSRLPAVLAALAVLVRTLASNRTAGGRAADLLLACAQRWWRHEDRVQRADVLADDRRWSRRLHFASFAADLPRDKG